MNNTSYGSGSGGGGDNGSVFLRILVIIIAAIFFLFVGSMFTLGMLAVVNKVSPQDLLRGKATPPAETGTSQEAQQPEKEEASEAQQEAQTGAGEDIELPGLQAKGEVKIITLEEFNDAVSKVVEDATPSVVNIKVKVKQQDIFGQEYLAEGVGSGVIYTQSGYILTNNHVAGNAEELLVTLYDGSEYPAKLVGADKDTDVAVVKIDAPDLKAASFTSIENVKVGEMAIAIGSPFGLSQTVTVGVVSAKGRDIAISSDMLPMVDLIQTDAAINQGNSGGPLLNSSGQVIGINTLIFSPSGASAGIGFAIPSDTAVNIANQIIKYGRARIPFIGIEMGENTTDVVGVYVKGVMRGYPAQKAGLKAGDVIVEFDGVEIKSPYELLAQILRHNVGDVVEVKVYRGGQYLTLNIEMVETPSS